ncbi:hypothetical protein [Chitinophaga rhizosphaerae]|uniref:hypothetical protein n=1 Tax=Chitinophaga rhizosphaerae TaxID=1864947 RepID=UPI000F809CE8|nr:hypothetical protein [Chitinophaga rhizosphaerae]
MKIAKLSFALVIAVLAIGVSVAANANKLGKRTITACYEVVLLQNSANSATYAPAQTDLASFVNTQVVTNQIKFLKQAPSTINDVCNETDRFCCAIFTEAPAGTPATVPNVTIGAVTAKWVVQSIKLHN